MYELSAPAYSGYRETFETAAQAEEKACEIMGILPTTLVTIDSNGVTYCYSSQEIAEVDNDGAYTVKYWEVAV